MRINCKLPGYEECFVEVSEKWTRGEIRRFWRGALGTGEESDADNLLVQKTVAVHLVTADGMEIDDADDLNDEMLDSLDYELYIWLSNAYGEAIAELQKLTKKNVQTSFVSNAEKKK